MAACFSLTTRERQAILLLLSLFLLGLAVRYWHLTHTGDALPNPAPANSLTISP